MASYMISRNMPPRNGKKEPTKGHCIQIQMKTQEC